MGEAAGDLAARRALNNLAFFRHNAGEGVQRELLMRADALERQAPKHTRDDTPAWSSDIQLYINGELAEAREVLSPSANVPPARLPRPRGFAFLVLAEVEVRTGRWSLADDWARRTLEASTGSDLWNAEAAGNWARALVDAHLGRVESARAHAETGRRLAADLGDLVFATRCAHVLGFLALSLGDAEAAVHHLAPLPSRRRSSASSSPPCSASSPMPLRRSCWPATSTPPARCRRT